MNKRILLLGFCSFALSILSPSLVLPAEGKMGDALYNVPEWDTTGEALQNRAKNKKLNQQLFGAPGWAAVLKSAMWFGGPLAMMLYANKKLKKHDEATRIKLREQQLMEGGANPMAQLMAMMQGAGAAGGFPDAEVRNPMMAEMAGEQGANNDDEAAEKDPNKEPAYEKDILSPGMKRFWTTMSWLGAALAIHGGFCLASNVGAHASKWNKNRKFNERVAEVKKANKAGENHEMPVKGVYPKEDYPNIPAVIAEAENAYRRGCDKLNKANPDASINDARIQAMFVRQELAEDEELKNLLKTWTDKQNKEANTDENLLKHSKEGMRLKLEQAVDNVRYNTRRNLQGRVPSTLRAVFGSDVAYRTYQQLFQREELRKPIPKATGEDTATTED